MYELSLKTMRRIKLNYIWALGTCYLCLCLCDLFTIDDLMLTAYNIILIPVAAGIFYPTYKFSFSPMMAGIAMSCSSVCIIVSSLLLNYISLPDINRLESLNETYGRYDVMTYLMNLKIHPLGYDYVYRLTCRCIDKMKEMCFYVIKVIRSCLISSSVYNYMNVESTVNVQNDTSSHHSLNLFNNDQKIDRDHDSYSDRTTSRQLKSCLCNNNTKIKSVVNSNESSVYAILRNVGIEYLKAFEHKSDRIHDDQSDDCETIDDNTVGIHGKTGYGCGCICEDCSCDTDCKCASKQLLAHVLL